MVDAAGVERGQAVDDVALVARPLARGEDPALLELPALLREQIRLLCVLFERRGSLLVCDRVRGHDERERRSGDRAVAPDPVQTERPAVRQRDHDEEEDPERKDHPARVMDVEAERRDRAADEGREGVPLAQPEQEEGHRDNLDERRQILLHCHPAHDQQRVIEPQDGRRQQ